LLYHEATFLHEKLNRAEETMHTTALQAGKIGAAAAVDQLLIGHFSSRYDDLSVLLNEAKSEFENTELATEGKTIILS
jgi:ribonuclease Z